MQVRVGISKRHVHLTEDVYNKLFGDEKITVRNVLSQIGEFASNSLVTIKRDDKKIENVRVIGPFREYNQVEIARSDAKFLEVNPPVRHSGDLEGAQGIAIIGPMGEIFLEKALIIAKKHIHMSTGEAKDLGLENDQKILCNIYNEKKEPLEVYLKATNNGVLEIHIDNDEALEYGLKNGDMVDIKL